MAERVGGRSRQGPTAVAADASTLVTAAAVPDRFALGSGRKMAANAAAGGVANLFKILIQLVMLPLMAHLLGPHEFGVYALALPTMLFCTSLADGGLGTVLARESERSRVVWSTAFWLLLGLGLVLALLVVVWGFALSALSHEPAVSGLMSFMALSLPLVTLSVLPSAWLTRDGRLAVQSAADLAATLVGAVCAVTLALKDFGAWSLSTQYVASFVVRAVILNAAAFVPPTREFKLSTLRPHLAIGSSLISGRLGEFAGRLIENLLFGRAFGAASLANYAFANQAPKFICEAMSGPTWGALYAVALRNDRSRVAAVHQKLLYLLVTVLFPMAFLVSASAPELLPIVLGPKWSGAAPLIQMIIPAYALTVVGMQSTALLLAAGRSGLLFWFSAGSVLARIVGVSIGIWITPVAVAAGLGIAQVIAATVMLVTPSEVLGPEFGPSLRDLLTPLLSSGGAGLVCYALLRLEPARPWCVFVALAAGGATYLLALLVFDRPRLIETVRQLRSLIRG